MAEHYQVSGILPVDKPVGPTSHDIVLNVRRLLDTRVGHAGTLDPMASGVLILTLGQATRLTRFFQQTDKVYEADLQLGTVTTSYDLEGEVIGRFPIPPIGLQKTQRIVDSFRGTITQLPPMFSAVKVGGEPLYKAARRKEIRERPLRQITIYSIELMAQKGDHWRLKIDCSAGTYIRTLANDLGVRLGCGACLSRLRRVRSGDFTLKECVELEASGVDLAQKVIPMEELLPHYPRIDVGPEDAMKVGHGQTVRTDKAHSSEKYCRLFAEGRLMAIGEVTGHRAHPKVVFKNR